MVVRKSLWIFMLLLTAAHARIGARAPQLAASQAAESQPAASPRAAPQPAPPAVSSYVVGPQDILTITSYDQADLSGKFSIEADGTFTYPLIGRFRAGGLTLRQVEDGLKARLRDEGYFRNPQVTVSVET